MRITTAFHFTLAASAFVACMAAIMPETTADAPHEAKTLYLQLYSNRYDIHSMGRVPSPPRDWQCIATVSVVSGSQFFFHLPCHYEPEMRIEGKISRKGNRVDADFVIDVADVGPAYHHEQKTPIAINTLHDFGDEDFLFSISDSREPAVIPSPRSRADN